MTTSTFISQLAHAQLFNDDIYVYSQLAHPQLFNDDIYVYSHNRLMLSCLMTTSTFVLTIAHAQLFNDDIYICSQLSHAQLFNDDMDVYSHNGLIHNCLMTTSTLVLLLSYFLHGWYLGKEEASKGGPMQVEILHFLFRLLRLHLSLLLPANIQIIKHNFDFNGQCQEILNCMHQEYKAFGKLRGQLGIRT
jgi:hypothetical protein